MRIFSPRRIWGLYANNWMLGEGRREWATEIIKHLAIRKRRPSALNSFSYGEVFTFIVMQIPDKLPDALRVNTQKGMKSLLISVAPWMNSQRAWCEWAKTERKKQKSCAIRMEISAIDNNNDELFQKRCQRKIFALHLTTPRLNANDTFCLHSVPFIETFRGSFALRTSP